MCKISRISGFLIYIFALVILGFVLVNHSKAAEKPAYGSGFLFDGTPTETYTYTKTVTTTETYTRPKKVEKVEHVKNENLFPRLEDENGDPIPVPAPTPEFSKSHDIGVDLPLDWEDRVTVKAQGNALETRIQERENQAALLNTEDEVETE